MAVLMPYEAIECPECRGPSEPVEGSKNTQRLCRWCFTTFEVIRKPHPDGYPPCKADGCPRYATPPNALCSKCRTARRARRTVA